MAPRFEDAFIDILGGGPGGRSELAKRAEVPQGKQEATVEAKDLTKKFGTFTAVNNITFGPTWGNIRLAGTKRRRQVDNISNALRTAEAVQRDCA